jgi:hypothetical protein
MKNAAGTGRRERRFWPNENRTKSRTETEARKNIACSRQTDGTNGGQNVKICSGRFSAGLGATVSWRGLMIGRGGSTTKRAAADVIGAGCVGIAAGAVAMPVLVLVEDGTGRDSTDLIGRARAVRGATGRSGTLEVLGIGARSPVPRKSLTRVSTS